MESSLAAPMMASFGEELHKTVFDKAAAYLFSIARNHPFVDGNKRTASSTALIFLRINGEIPKYNNYTELQIDNPPWGLSVCQRFNNQN